MSKETKAVDKELGKALHKNLDAIFSKINEQDEGEYLRGILAFIKSMIELAYVAGKPSPLSIIAFNRELTKMTPEAVCDELIEQMNALAEKDQENK